MMGELLRQSMGLTDVYNWVMGGQKQIFTHTGRLIIEEFETY